MVYIPLLGKKRNIERVLMFYKKLDNNCKYDTINQVFVKNTIFISGVLMYGKKFDERYAFVNSIFFANKNFRFYLYYSVYGLGGNVRIRAL